MADNSSVKVAVRIRPLVKSEIDRGCKNILEVYKELSQCHVKDSDKSFTYNYMFDTDSNQLDIYNTCVRDIIPNLFKGYNLTILAYGQTGSGKTYSMGTTYSGGEDMGVIPRSIKQIFDFVKDNFSFDFTITVSFMELYQEVLFDLLADKPREQCTLEIREDHHRGIHIPGLSEVPVESASDVFDCLVRGSSGRATASTNMNSQSSRSHAIFTINISMQSKANSEENRTSKFHLVDLAGSERPKKTGAVGNTFREGININKGLLVLGNVISALGEEKQENRFIPYRDSNLTRLLKDSLGGNSITLMIACVSPADYNIDETLSTLRYADRARKIKNKPVINQDPKTAQINDLKKTIKTLQLQLIGQGGVSLSSDEVFALKKQIESLKSKNRDLTNKLSSALNDRAGLLERFVHLQNSNEILTEKMSKLKKSHDVIQANMTFAIEQGSIDSLRDCKDEFEGMKQQFEDVNSELKKTESDINQHDVDISNIIENNCNEVQAKEINDLQENYASRQIELNNELKDVMKKLAMKELLAKEMAKNVHYMVDYENIRQNEIRIEALEKEKSELTQQLKSAQNNLPSKLSEDRRKRVKELEGQIQDMMKKLNEQNRLIRLKEKDEQKMKQLNHEILQMKQNRVKLIRSMKEESERFRTWKMQRERELIKLKQEDNKKKHQIQKMQTMHLKQQNVLKRKVDEAVAANKRLKDALATRKLAQQQKFSGKLEKVTGWLKHEVEVLLGLTEIEERLNGLLEDRAMLQKQLNTFKSDSNPDSIHIKSLEEDIELRSVQIQDMQQKLFDANEDDGSKYRINFDNIQTMVESKQAVKVLIDQILELKRKECRLTMKSIEFETTTIEESSQKKYEKIIEELEQKQNEALNKLEREYEEKITILLGQLRGIEMKESTPENENLKAIIEMLQVRITEQEKKIEEMENVMERTNVLSTEIYKNEATPPREILNEIHSQEEYNNAEDTPPKKMKLHSDITFVCPTSEKENIKTMYTEEEHSFVDDISKDPDWVKTPIGKKVIVDKKNLALQKNRESTKPAKLNFDNSDDSLPKIGVKRSSQGNCACSTNCSKRCGCRRSSRKCSGSCKCNTLLCTNSMDSDEQNGDVVLDESGDFKKPRVHI